ncbi:MAG: type II secretion system F family protein [Atopobium sp.]|nr:type II secretion system F family protein [Atopobium sp.]
MIDLTCSLAFALCIAILVLVMPVNLNQFDFHRYYQQIMRGVKGLRRVSRRAKLEFTRKSCLREMPEMIDILILGLSSGLSFDSALDLYCLRESGELSKELSNAHMTWKLGATTREEALNQMAARVGVPSLKSFATVVNEALTFGTPLAEILDRQASVLRDEQRSLLETEIEKIPIKMLIPLGTLIVPAMLLAILGPLLGPAFSS